MEHLSDLERQGAMSWRADEHAWRADPEQVVGALTREGFDEYKCEIAKDGRTHIPSGGMWQGLDPRTGTVATVIWVSRPRPREAHVFIEIGGSSVEGSPYHSGFQASAPISMS
jgi:hypothetical protein